MNPIGSTMETNFNQAIRGEVRRRIGQVFRRRIPELRHFIDEAGNVQFDTSPGEGESKEVHPTARHPTGRGQVPNPDGISSRGDFTGGQITHHPPAVDRFGFNTGESAPKFFIQTPRSELLTAGFNERVGGSNEDLIKLSNASFVREANKYNVVFGGSVPAN
jgi:hypothetical protein